MLKKVLKHSIEFLIAAALVAGSVWYLNDVMTHRDSLKKKKSSMPSVVTERQHFRTFQDRIEGLGTGVAKESVDITATVTEKVGELNFEDGQTVRRGTVLVRLEDAEERAEKRQAEINIQEQLREMKRIQTLFGAKAASQKSFDEQKTSLERAKMKLDVVKAQLADRRITAPFDGVLGTRLVSVGDLVTPGSKVTTIDDLSEIKVDFNLPEKYFARLKTGREVTITTAAYPGKNFTGRITFVGTRINPTTRSIDVRAVIPNPRGELRPGMMFNVYADMGVRSALMIPEKAVMSLGELQYVFVLRPDMTVKRTPVKLGIRANGKVEAVSGIQNGASIVVEGVAKLVDGMKVNLRQEIRQEGPETKK